MISDNDTKAYKNVRNFFRTKKFRVNEIQVLLNQKMQISIIFVNRHHGNFRTFLDSSQFSNIFVFSKCKNL